MELLNQTINSEQVFRFRYLCSKITVEMGETDNLKFDPLDPSGSK